MSTTQTLDNPEFLFGNIEAARQACETEANGLVESGSGENSPLVLDLDEIIVAIEKFQAAWGGED